MLLLVVVKEADIMHNQRHLPSDSSVGLKHEREERHESLYATHSTLVKVIKRRERRLKTNKLIQSSTFVLMQTQHYSMRLDLKTNDKPMISH